MCCREDRFLRFTSFVSLFANNVECIDLFRDGQQWLAVLSFEDGSEIRLAARRDGVIGELRQRANHDTEGDVAFVLAQDAEGRFSCTPRSALVSERTGGRLW